MNRRAILIESSKLKGCDDLPGARADQLNVSSFLQSTIGGAWESSEITLLNNPTNRDLRRALKVAETVDYAVVAFFGHGEHLRGKELDETIVCLNNEENTSVRNLNPGNPRCLIVVDCCRKLVLMEREMLKFSLSKAASRTASNRGRCRAIFDDAVSQCEKGAITMYSCDIDEAAGETSAGGHFTGALLASATRWAESQHSATVLRTNTAFGLAKEATTERNKQQHPVMEAGRRMTHFPFAVFC